MKTTNTPPKTEPTMTLVCDGNASRGRVVIGSFGTEATTGLVTVAGIVDCTVEWFVSTAEASVLTLGVDVTLLHLTDRAKLHRLFGGTPGTWH